MGWTDQEIESSREKVAEICEILLRVRPDIVISHLPTGMGDVEDDHPVVGQIAASAVRMAANRVPQFDGIEPHRVKQMFFSFAGGEELNSRNVFGGGIVPDVWIDTTPVIEKKVHAIDQLVSQGYQEDCARWIVEARDGRWGMIAGCAYAEPFLRPQGITYGELPMPDRVRDKQYVPTDMPRQRTSAHQIPSATPPEAYRLLP